MSKWISVKDRLPEHGVHVLTFSSEENYYAVSYLIYLSNERIWANGCLLGNDNITHWMPLPKPPEIKEDNEK